MALTSRQKKILFNAFIIVAIIIVIAIFFRKARPAPITLEFWGIRDEATVFTPLIQEFQKTYPHITINYLLKSEKSYHEDLLKALADNKAPDILMLQDNWLPYYEDKIYPLDLNQDKFFNLLDLKNTYSPVSLSNTLWDSYLLGLPLYTDTLALYYNKDIFNHYNIALAPSTWEEVINLIPFLRQMNPQGQISRSAIALGSAANIEWETDILSALMIQYGSTIVDLSKNQAVFNMSIQRQDQNIVPGEQALNFYIQFFNPYSKNYTWNDNFDNSVIAFSRGKAVMMVGYNQAKKIIKQYNPNLNYSVTTLPQFTNSSSNINYGYTMDLVVLKSSHHLKESWNFLKFLSQKNMAQYYFNQTKNPPTRLDLIQESLNDLDSGIFIRQILTSYSWYQFDFQEIKRIFKEMITAVALKGEVLGKAVITAKEKIDFFWK